MSRIKQRIQHKIHDGVGSDVFKNEKGAIDLSSIMVGIIVIGLIGGIIAATVFSIIPWAQDNAAKQQLDSIAAAESAYMGLASTTPPTIPAGATANSYADSAELKAANLLNTGLSYCVVPTADGKGYEAYAQSSSGKIWSASDKTTKPILHTGVLPTDCNFIIDSYGGPYVDPTPKLTTLTYKCDVTTAGVLPMTTNLTGTEKWDDGTPTQTYTNAAQSSSKTLTAGVTYKVTFEGTYKNFSSWSSAYRNCLRSVDHWGSETGVTSASSGFFQASNLADVPKNIPSTITNMSGMFNQASNFNDPDISKWNTSNVTNMSNMFNMTNAFNQSLNSWDTAKVTAMNGMFAESKSFNQPLNNWNTSNVRDMYAMFGGASKFNQPLDKWDVSKVTSMFQVFRSATAFNQPLNSWNIGSANSLNGMFSGATAFNQPLDKWNTSNVEDLTWTFGGATAFNQSINSWNTAKVKYMDSTFYNAPAFNQSLNDWNTAQVTSMSEMFSKATIFNQPLDKWDTTKVTNMRNMFQETDVFNQNISSWKTGSVTSMYRMFYYSKNFKQDLSGWNTLSLTNGTDFGQVATFPANYKPAGTTLSQW